MGMPNDEPGVRRQGRGRRLVVWILVLALLGSLLANGVLGGVAWWSYQGWRQEQDRAIRQEIELQQQVRQLQRDLEDCGESTNGSGDSGDVVLALDPVDAQMMDTVEEQVVELRELEPLDPVERAVIDRDGLYEKVLEDAFTPEEAQAYGRVLVAFDMIDPDLDMYDLLIRLYTEQIAGFYDSEVEQIYVVAEDSPAGEMERLTYAHEYTHALQDQHHDLEAMGLSEEGEDLYDSEYLSGVQALVEGDATLLQQQFLMAYYTAEEIAVLLEEMETIDTTVFDSAPKILREQLEFPYMYGWVFVQDLYDEGGWEAVDAAYASPPISTEQIIHPDRYRAGDAPQLVLLSPLTDTLGVGWRQVDEDIAGEFFLQFYLAQQIPIDEAEDAAEGWGGDRFAVHHRESDGALVMALHLVWDTPADAEAFVDAYVAYADGRFGHQADVADGARLCWEGDADTICMTWGPADATVVLGPDQAIVDAVLETVEE